MRGMRGRACSGAQIPSAGAAGAAPRHPGPGTQFPDTGIPDKGGRGMLVRDMRVLGQRVLNMRILVMRVLGVLVPGRRVPASGPCRPYVPRVLHRHRWDLGDPRARLTTRASPMAGLKAAARSSQRRPETGAGVSS